MVALLDLFDRYILRSQLGGDAIGFRLIGDVELLAVFGQKARPKRILALAAQKGLDRPVLLRIKRLDLAVALAD